MQSPNWNQSPNWKAYNQEPLDNPDELELVQNMVDFTKLADEIEENADMDTEQSIDRISNEFNLNS